MVKPPTRKLDVLNVKVLLSYDEMNLYEHRYVMDTCDIQVSDKWWSETDMQENEKWTRGST